MSSLLDASPQSDNRREPRYRVFSPAHLHMVAAQKVDARVRDISFNGLGLTSSEPVPVGAELPITIGVPSAGRSGSLLALECRIVVVNRVLCGRDYRIGATWVDLRGNKLELIELWIRSLRAAGPTYRVPDDDSLQWSSASGH